MFVMYIIHTLFQTIVQEEDTQPLTGELYCHIVALFDLFLYVPSTSFSYARVGLPGLNQY